MIKFLWALYCGLRYGSLHPTIRWDTENGTVELKGFGVRDVCRFIRTTGAGRDMSGLPADLARFLEVR